MTAPTLPWWRRLGIAFKAFFGILADGTLAAAWPPPLLAAPSPREPRAPASDEKAEDGALLLLALLQSEGRFVDFVQQDIGPYSDSDVGAVARVVHAGCRKVLAAHFQVSPVRSEPEGQALALESGFDARQIKLTGKVAGSGPLQGVLRHRGWLCSEVKLPSLVDRSGVRVLCPAEVEL